MAADMVSRADAGFVNIWGLQDCAETIHEFADEEQKEKYLTRVCNGETMAMDLTEPDAGSDLQAVELKAHLRRKRRLVTKWRETLHYQWRWPHFASTCPFGRRHKRWSRSFDVHLRQNHGGVTVRRIEHKMGIIGSPTCELVFKDAPAELVGQRRMGLIKYVMALMNGARLGIAAQSVVYLKQLIRKRWLMPRNVNSLVNQSFNSRPFTKCLP
jgi:3-(methylthio)propanoyl-CoA dehydrogenase